MLITGAILNKIVPSVKGLCAENIAKHLSDICPMYGINTADIFHEFLANLLEECWEFGKFEENLNYSAKRLTEVWPSRFKTIAAAVPYARNPRKLAGKVYDNRKDLGNTHPGDGWTFRGSGPIQMTGRDNVTRFTIFYNSKFGTSYNVLQMAELLRTDIAIGIHSACWIFAVSKKLIQLAINDNMKEIVRRINGGYTNLAKRNQYYLKVKRYVK